MRRTMNVLFKLALRGCEAFVNGYLLHPRRRSRVLAAMALLVGAVAVVALLEEKTPATVSPEGPVPIAAASVQPLDREAYLMGRFWLDRMPRGERDPFQLYIFQENSTGAHISVESNFRFSIELFRFAVREKTIQFEFPHGKQKSSSTYTIEDHRGAGGLNLKMNLAADPRFEGKPRAFFSFLERGSSDLPEWLAKAVRVALTEFGKS